MSSARYIGEIIDMKAILPTCKDNRYQLHWGMKICCVGFIFMAIFVLKISQGWHFAFFLIGSPLLIIICLGGLFARNIIDDEGLRTIIGPVLIRRVSWNDIGIIYDDNFSSSHFYTFKLRNKTYWKSFIYNNACTNYCDFLRESILRVRPDTEVDPKILRLIGFTPADIGKLHKPSTGISNHPGQASTTDNK